MIRAPALRGALLEEVILHLLRLSGYVPIEKAGTDPTLIDGTAGLEVRGRGWQHQIDAVADFMVPQPFSYPQRLLVEAKCYSDIYPVGLPVVRNAVGVVKDVSEYWVGAGHPRATRRTRYHYRYAVFSASDFTNDAERYAFAQDVYLLPLKKSRFFRPLVIAIRRFNDRLARAIGHAQPDLRLSDIRRMTRTALRNGVRNDVPAALAAELENLVRQCREIRGALLAVLAGQFPVFLVPGPDLNIHELRPEYSVAIRWDNRGWYLYSPDERRLLFSFDLPPELFLLYSNEGELRPERALDLKQDIMSEFSAIIVKDGEFRQVVFHLDAQWLGTIRDRLRRQSQIKDNR